MINPFSISSLGVGFGPSYVSAIGFREAMQTGRSGYWRLFFMQMQEDSLKKDKEKLKAVIKEAVAQAEPVAIKATSKKKQKLEPLVPLEVYEKPVFRRKPIYTSPASNTDTLRQLTVASSLEIQAMYAQFVPHLVARQIKIQRQVEAANDADYRIRLLLLLAA